MSLPRKIIRHLCWFSSALLVTGCISEPPLHPQTSISSGEFSELQASYDVQHYALNLAIHPERRAIEGDVSMAALALKPLSVIELDLDPRFAITAAEVNGVASTFELAAGKLTFSNVAIAVGESFTTRVVYEGRPHVAENPPWQGGFVWSETESGEHWIATAVQGRGCDLFWPCKDHISDKPDRGADMYITVPGGLVAAMNGALISESTAGGTSTFHWRTSNPVSTYHLAINIAPYETYEVGYSGSIEGKPTIPVVFYYVPGDEAKFEKVEKLIKHDFLQQIAFMENTLGPYPWGEEKIGVVETPHLGMEHQTINAYGNNFEVNNAGFDWLILHELAHEWFGNLMTQESSRDFWLHEGTASYMDSLYYQKQAGAAGYWSHMWEIYNEIANCKPIVPDDPATSMDYFDSNDVYYKGAWSLHTLRWLMGETAFWNTVRRTLYSTTDPWSLTYPITPVSRSSEDFIAIASEEHGADLNWFFDVYFKQTELPRLESERNNEGLLLKWVNYPDFQMPVPIEVVSDGDAITRVLPANGVLHPLPSTASVRIDPETRVFRDFGYRQWCQE